MVGRIFEKIVERFISKKLGAFIASLAAGLIAAARLSPERLDSYLTFAAIISGTYLGAQGAGDAAERFAKAWKGLAQKRQGGKQ